MILLKIDTNSLKCSSKLLFKYPLFLKLFCQKKSHESIQLRIWEQNPAGKSELTQNGKYI